MLVSMPVFTRYEDWGEGEDIPEVLVGTTNTLVGRRAAPLPREHPPSTDSRAPLPFRPDLPAPGKQIKAHGVGAPPDALRRTGKLVFALTTVWEPGLCVARGSNQVCVGFASDSIAAFLCCSRRRFPWVGFEGPRSRSKRQRTEPELDK